MNFKYKKPVTAIAVSSFLLVSNIASAKYLDTFGFSNQPVDGFLQGEITPIFWDKRCSNVEYTFNSAQLPNELDESIPTISLEDAVAEVQASLDSWNEIPTSYINMNITNIRDTGNPARTFDFINEVTFNTPDGFGALASSPSTSLDTDTQFNPGDDLDGDGDSDVYDPEVEGMNVCTDVDNDGDIEFPAGFYLAGTILENDVQFSETVDWELTPSNSAFADIRAVSVHEFGHSHGLAHAAINNISEVDGGGTTMFPFIDTGDGLSEEQTRSPHDDDIAWSSYAYPEGSDTQGIAALQEGDIAFTDVYALLSGSIEDSLGNGVAGASVTAVAKSGNLSIQEVEAISGRFPLELRLSDGAVFIGGIITGEYEIPVKQGRYELIVQALDGGPVEASRVSNLARLGGLFTLPQFPEETLSRGSLESSVERDAFRTAQFRTRPGDELTDLTFVINSATNLLGYNSVTNIGSGAAAFAEDAIYAVRFNNEVVLNTLNSGRSLIAALIDTGVIDASLIPKFKRAMLAYGTVDEETGIADINMSRPIQQKKDFVAQPDDLAPLNIRAPNLINRSVRSQLSRNPDLDLFVVVEVDDAQVGPSGIPPLVRLDNSTFGSSFLSTAGGPFNSFNGNWAIQLAFTGE